MLPNANKENRAAAEAPFGFVEACIQAAEAQAQKATQARKAAQAQNRMHQPQLLGIAGPAEGTKMWLPLRVGAGAAKKEIVLGRSSNCDVRTLDDDKISRQHLKIKTIGDQLWLTDIDTTFGTRLRGEPVRGWTRAGHGDELALGASLFQLLLMPAEAQTPQGLPPTLPGALKRQGRCPPLPPSAPRAPMKHGSSVATEQREKVAAEAKAAAEARQKAALDEQEEPELQEAIRRSIKEQVELELRRKAALTKMRNDARAQTAKALAASEAVAEAVADAKAVEAKAAAQAKAAADAAAAEAAETLSAAMAAEEAEEAEAEAPDISDVSAPSLGLRDCEEIEVLWQLAEDDGRPRDVWWRARLRLSGCCAARSLGTEAAATRSDGGGAVLEYAAMHGFEAETLSVRFLDGSAAFHVSAHDGWLRHAGSKIPWRRAPPPVAPPPAASPPAPASSHAPPPAAASSSHAPAPAASSQLPPALPGMCRAVKQNGGLCSNKINPAAPRAPCCNSSWREHTCGVHKSYKGELRPPPLSAATPPPPPPSPPPPPPQQQQQPSTDAAMAQQAAEAKARLAEERARKKSLEMRDLRERMAALERDKAAAEQAAAAAEQAAAAEKAAMAITDPSAWTPVAGDVAMVRVPASSDEHDHVESDFRRSISAFFLQSRYRSGQQPQVLVEAVHRVQNRPQWRRYCLLRDELRLRERAPDDAAAMRRFERERLYHGTDEATADKIAHNNFNRSFCGKNATRLGHGSYFALHAGYSLRYAPPDGRGVRRIYACRVLNGEYCRGQQDMREPPPRPGRGHLPYDSTVDDTARPEIYVTYKDSQAYPEYLISFRLDK